MLTEKLYLIGAITSAFILSYKNESDFILDFTLLTTGVIIGMMIVCIKRPDIIGK